jgi:predicted dehydrogenase
MGTAKATRVRWGVIGAGGIARRRTIPEGILPSSNAVLAAVYDPRDCEAIAREFDAQACSSESELFASDIDAVYIATPVHRHVEQVLAAAAAGKHVLCEKPLGLDVAEAQRIVDACEAADVKLGVGLLMRFHACHRAALDLVRQSRLGRMVLGRAQLSCWYPAMAGAWRQEPGLGGGGSLIDMGCHCIDLLEMFLGRSRRVMCMAGRVVQDYPVEDTATVLLEFESGAQGMVDCLFNVPDESVQNRLELYGSEGSILAAGTLGQDAGGEMVWRSRARQGGYDARQARSGDGAVVISPTPVNTYRAQIEAFSDAVLNDAAAPVDGHAGLWNQRVIAACYESARTGSAVDLSIS